MKRAELQVGDRVYLKGWKAVVEVVSLRTSDHHIAPNRVEVKFPGTGTTRKVTLGELYPITEKVEAELAQAHREAAAIKRINERHGTRIIRRDNGQLYVTFDDLLALTGDAEGNA